MDFDEVVRARRSVRGFTSEPVPRDVLEEIFGLAQRAPSNCNVQPWRVFVASGAVRDELSRRMVEATHAALSSGGAGLPVMRFEGDYRRLQVECAQSLYGAMGVARDDLKGRLDAVVRNYEFFGAPHVAFVCMEEGFDVGVALDVGMYIQTLMLALWSRGIGSCAQAALASHVEITRHLLEIPENLRVLCGLSFGYEDESVPANRTRQARDATDRNVRFFGV
jgi:nitroreductase